MTDRPAGRRSNGLDWASKNLDLYQWVKPSNIQSEVVVQSEVIVQCEVIVQRCALFMRYAETADVFGERVEKVAVPGESQEGGDAKLWPWLHLDLIVDFLWCQSWQFKLAIRGVEIATSCDLVGPHGQPGEDCTTNCTPFARPGVHATSMRSGAVH